MPAAHSITVEAWKAGSEKKRWMLSRCQYYMTNRLKIYQEENRNVWKAAAAGQLQIDKGLSIWFPQHIGGLR